MHQTHPHRLNALTDLARMIKTPAEIVADASPVGEPREMLTCW